MPEPNKNKPVEILIEELFEDESGLCPFCGAKPEEEDYMCTNECESWGMREEDTPFPLNFEDF